MAFTAFPDTNALYGEYLCDTLLRLAEAGTYQPLWSAGVLEELERNLVDNAGLAPDAVRRRIGAMQRAFPDAKVRGYEGLIESMTCDGKDRHVLAAAVRGQSDVLVTFNVSDFPEESTTPHDVEVINPDDFLLDQLRPLSRDHGDGIAPPSRRLCCACHDDGATAGRFGNRRRP